MSGKRITINQIRLFMQSKENGKSIAVSAARAGFSERTAYNVSARSYKVANNKRDWKTRSDPFEEVSFINYKACSKERIAIPVANKNKCLFN